MSEIAAPHHFSSATSQLPIAWYSDQAIFELEKKLLFDASSGYVGHQLMVPEAGCYRALEYAEQGHILFNAGKQPHKDESFYWLMSNVCRHRQAIMLRGSGLLEKTITCPIHRWTYNTQGELLGAPHFSQNPCLNLERTPLESWNGLLFKGPRSVAQDLAGMKAASEFDFNGYKLEHVELHECNYNWKTFIEVYLEDYHVEPFHPGLGNFVNCDELSWQFGERYSVQKVGITDLSKPGSRTYSRFHQLMREQQAHSDKASKQGAVWLTYFPNIMVEWYPNVLVVSTLIPKAIDKTLNIVEFYYPEEIVDFEREFIEAEQAAYMETAVEDDEIAERMDQGRLALMRAGRNEVGPYQSPMEDGMQHFHEFYRRIISKHLD